MDAMTRYSLSLAVLGLSSYLSEPITAHKGIEVDEHGPDHVVVAYRVVVPQLDLQHLILQRLVITLHTSIKHKET